MQETLVSYPGYVGYSIYGFGEENVGEFNLSTNS